MLITTPVLLVCRSVQVGQVHLFLRFDVSSNCRWFKFHAKIRTSQMQLREQSQKKDVCLKVNCNIIARSAQHVISLWRIEEMRHHRAHHVCVNVWTPAMTKWFDQRYQLQKLWWDVDVMKYAWLILCFFCNKLQFNKLITHCTSTFKKIEHPLTRLH